MGVKGQVDAIVSAMGVQCAMGVRPPRSLVVPVRARIAQGQREEAPGRVEVLARRAERHQRAPALSLPLRGNLARSRSRARASAIERPHSDTTAALHRQTLPP